MNYITTQFSRGLISSFFFIENYDILFDCGDGAVSHLFRKLGSIKYLAITHEHFDHISGLVSLLNLRARVAPNVPLVLFLPGRHRRFDFMFEMLGPKALKNVNIVYIESEKEYDIGGCRLLIPFKTEHSSISHGYLIKDKRTRLKKEYSGYKEKELGELVKSGYKLSEPFLFPLLAYVGDSAPLPDATISLIKGVVTLVSEATFLTEKERMAESAYFHSSMEYIPEIIRKVEPEEVIINHVSPRYSDGQIKKAAREIQFSCKDVGFYLSLGKDLIPLE